MIEMQVSTILHDVLIKLISSFSPFLLRAFCVWMFCGTLKIVQIISFGVNSLDNRMFRMEGFIFLS